MGRRRRSVPTEVFEADTTAPVSGAPGRTRDGARSPLIRTRRDDARWVLGSRPVRALLVLVLVACVAWPTYTLAWPAAQAWWDDTTNPEVPTPSPSVSVTYVETDGTPVFYGLEDASVEFEADFDPLDGVRALDVEDGDVTDQIKVSGKVDTGKPGDYDLTYEVTDSYGNTAEQERTIAVEPEPTPTTTEPEPEPTTTRPPEPTQPATTTRPPEPTQPATTRPPEPTQAPTTRPPSATRVSTSQAVTCSGPASVTVTARGGGNVQLSGSASGAGGTSVTRTVSTDGGTLNFTATADNTVFIEWSAQGPCS